MTSAGTLLVLLVSTVPLTTLTSTAAGLHAGTGAQAWILSAMPLGMAAALLASGAMGDDYGRRRMFIAGALLLAAFSFLGGLAPNPLLLILARIVQGVGAAAIVACGLGIIGHFFPEGPARASATSVWAGALGAGVAIGPFVATGLMAVGGWRLPYMATGLAGLGLAAAGIAVLPESRSPYPRPVDLAGSALLGLGVALLMVGLVVGRAGWSFSALALLVLGGLLLAGFVWVESRIDHPMFDLSLLRLPDFVGATLAAFAAGMGILSLSTVIPSLVERGLGHSTLAATLVLFAWSGTSSVAGFAARWLPGWISSRALLIVGLVGCAVGELALLVPSAEVPVLRLLPGLVFVGLANGLLNSALGSQAVASVPASRTAMGSGANNTARYLGSAVGITIVVMLINREGDLGTAGVITGWNSAVLVTVAFMVLGALGVAFSQRRSAAKGKR